MERKSQEYDTCIRLRQMGKCHFYAEMNKYTDNVYSSIAILELAKDLEGEILYLSHLSILEESENFGRNFTPNSSEVNNAHW